MIEIKSRHEAALIEEAGKVVRAVLSEVGKIAKPGITTAELDKKAADISRHFNVRPAFKGYKGFPANICASINDEVVHGIPGKRRLKNGDILSVDFGAERKGFYADAAVTVPVGNRVSEKALNLMRVTKKALALGIKKAVEGNRLFDISYAIQEYAEANGYSVVRDFVGHGIGKNMHEAPEIPNFGRPHTGPLLKRGMVLAIEPMINEGSYEVNVQEDGWTVATRDHSLSAHFEHTICVTEKGPKILT